MNEIGFIPLFLGSDLNCYNCARAFHEAYSINSYAFGRYAIGATMNTKIVNFTAVPELDNPDTMVKTVNDFADSHKDKKIILLGCTDDYVSMIIHNKHSFSGNIIAPYIDKEQEDVLTNKARFYEFCDKYGIPHPVTRVIRSADEVSCLPFDYPIIVKPAVSSSYWKHEFEGMKKVYRAKDESEAKKIVKQIFDSGYPDEIILQDTVPGDDSHMYVLTAYSGEDGKVRMMTLGHVLLEEHTPKGLGNHCAIVTEYKPELCEKFKTFLEDIGYVGFANFDIKFDERDGVYKAFEINTRQGRSNYYVTASGNNIARCIVDDKIFHKKSETQINKNEIYWRYVPDSIVYKYVSDEIKEKIKELKRKKQAFSSMRYNYDLAFNLRRRLFVMMHEMRHKKKFKKYYHPEQQ